MSQHHCESCGMPIEIGPYCQFCVDSAGNLQSFEDRFERMVSWQMGRNPTLERSAAERETLLYMSGMPAWKDHPGLRARL